jgi:hypothetical protein
VVNTAQNCSQEKKGSWGERAIWEIQASGGSIILTCNLNKNEMCTGLFQSIQKRIWQITDQRIQIHKVFKKEWRRLSHEMAHPRGNLKGTITVHIKKNLSQERPIFNHDTHVSSSSMMARES